MYKKHKRKSLSDTTTIIMHSINNSLLQFRSRSQEQLLHTPDHRRSNSTQSADLFTLVVPKDDGSPLSSLLCQICSLPMMQPTLLPCQHTFCFKCIQNNQQIRPCSLPIHSNNCLSLNDNQIKIITCPKCLSRHRINSFADLEQNHSIELLINTLLCETCHQLYPSNQLDTCLHCYGVLCSGCYDEHVERHQNELSANRNLYRIISMDETVNISTGSKSIEKDQPSKDSQILKVKSFNTEKQPTIKSTQQKVEKENNHDENTDPSQTNNTKTKSFNIFRRLISPSQHRHSTKEHITNTPPSSVKQTCSVKLPRRPRINIDTKCNEISKTESAPIVVPVTPVRRFLNLFDQYSHTAEHIKQCKQRQSELDRAVHKLIEVLKIKTNETIYQISQYWMHLKQLSLDQFQTKSNRFQIFDYLLKTCCSPSDSRKQIESFFEQNDEIKASLQVLATTLVIVNEQESLLTVTHLFDREEQTTIRTLRRQLELSLSSYADELSIILERIKTCESGFSAWKNCSVTDLDSITYEWSQIIEHDYPSLIERISNDFITKIPQIEKILVEMLKHMKQRLLNTDHQTKNPRTSIVNL